MSQETNAAPAADTDTSKAAPAEGEVNEEALVEADTAEETAEQKAAAAVAKSTKRKLSPKVNGRQLEVEIDPNNDEELLKYVQKAMAADEKFQEAANLRKHVEMLVNELKTNPKAVLSHPDLGLDIKKFAQDILNEELEEMQKTPEQRELEKLRKELEENKNKLKAEEEGKRTAEMDRMREQAFKQFDDDITTALEKSALPKSPNVVKRIADTLIEAINLGYTDTTVQDILPIVEEQFEQELQAMFETMPEETMEKLIGKKNLTRLRKKRLSQMKQGIETAKQVKETGTKSSDADEKSKEEKKRFKDLFGRF